MEEQYDLSGFICPISKMKATEFIKSLGEGEKATIIVGDTESLKTVAQELKSRGIQTAFEQAEDNKFILTFTK
ncbi:MAG: sulfurtransferase TusA family protein [Dehalococcoidales bacterium]